MYEGCSKRGQTLSLALQPTQRARCGYRVHLASGFDYKLPFVPFRYAHLSSSYIRWTEHVHKQFVGLVTKWQWKSLKNNVCVWNFAANLIKILQRHFNCLTKQRGDRVFSTEISMDELVKDQGVVGCVFWLERHCLSWICTTWSDGKQTVVPGSFSTFEGCCAQEEAWIVEKPDLDVAPQQCTGSRIAPHPQSSG